MSILLEQAKTDLEHAIRNAQQLRRQYNASLVEYREAMVRYERLVLTDIEMKVELARERDRASAEGNHVLAALLLPR